MSGLIARNPHQALPEAMRALREYGEMRESRNGKVILLDDPLLTTYTHPQERVVFWPERDANPFFHLFEALWMLRGRNDVEFVAKFSGNIANYSDDGETFHGAYGHRWRHAFGRDQLREVAGALRRSPDCRRQVVAMWDPTLDLGRTGKDLPCNTHAYLQRDVRGALVMTVCNRSNDAVWGAYGANAVHFTILQEYLAALVGCDVGRAYFFTANMHVYLDQHRDLMDALIEHAPDVAAGQRHTCPYSAEEVRPHPLMSIQHGRWDRELSSFFAAPGENEYDDPFLEQVVVPMWRAWWCFKDKRDPDRHAAALQMLRECGAEDWRRAAVEWIQRRQERARARGA